jgi:hypothetical protein
MLQNLYNAVFICLWEFASGGEEPLKLSFGLSSRLLKGFRYKAFSASPLAPRFAGRFSKG